MVGVTYPDPREDLESRSPNLGPCTTKGTLLKEPALRDLLFGYLASRILQGSEHEICSDTRRPAPRQPSAKLL